jgi:hypothetical protein
MRPISSWKRKAALLPIILLATSCGNDGAGPGAHMVTVPSQDSTPPDIKLGIVHINDSIVVEAGGQPAKLPQIKTGSGLTFTATATDNESGILDVQIWTTETRALCDADDTCTVSGPGAVQNPVFSNPQPQASPGDSAKATVVLAEVFEPSYPDKPSPGQYRTVTLDIWARGINQLTGKAETAHATVEWYRSG